MSFSNRFETNFDDLKFQDKNKNIVNGNPKDYINQLQSSHITVFDKAQIGDIIKIKGGNYDVLVTHTDFMVPNMGIVDYAGTKINSSNKRLVLFNQKDIELIVQKSRHSRSL